jgi:S-methylmethionine-dependent homocysteine/selenocysteine methylase
MQRLIWRAVGILQHRRCSTAVRRSADKEVTILDGGMGRELLRMGAPFQQPEWSALALIEAPHFVSAAHDAFVNAGADVITTNSYALVPFHIGEARWRADAARLAALAGLLARSAATQSQRHVLTAGSIPPVFGSYRPDLFNAGLAPALYAPLVTALAPFVDLWLCETQSSSTEALAAVSAVATLAAPRPVWVSYTLDDSPAAAAAPPRLRSGELVGPAAAAVIEAGAAAVLFNCSQPEAVEAALLAAAVEVSRWSAGGTSPAPLLGAYANAFPPQRTDAAANEDLLTLRADLTPKGYAEFARRWVAAGARIVGGCCGIGPEHVRELAGSLNRHSWASA